MLGCSQKKKLEPVDMGEAMKKAGLFPLFHVDLWPSATAVRELATQAKSKKFVSSDLRK